MNDVTELRKRVLAAPQNESFYNQVRFVSNKWIAGIGWLKTMRPNIKIDKNSDNLGDRVAYYMFNDIDMKKQRWSDKIRVYTELYELGLENLHIPMITDLNRTYYAPSDKDIFDVINRAVYYANDALPTVNDKPQNDTVIKCNHGSGCNIFIRRGEHVNYEYIMNKLKTWLNTNFAYCSGYEWQYENITPGLLIQPVIEDKPIDWQFYCENGEITCIDLQKKFAKSMIEHLATTDKDGNELPWYIGAKPAINNLPPNFKKIIEKMKPYVYKIAAEFNFVRVDLYCVNDKIYFGESTFSPCAGILDTVWR